MKLEKKNQGSGLSSGIWALDIASHWSSMPKPRQNDIWSKN